MYYPLQIPYVLDQTFLEYVDYRETIIEELTDFVICYWQMLPRRDEAIDLENVIILDGCIDLVVDFDEKIIGFSGMSGTDFHFPLHLPNRFMGLRLVPNAFHQLTGRNPQEAMDKLLLLAEIYPDFPHEEFFSLSFPAAKSYLINFMKSQTVGIMPDTYTKLFNELAQEPPNSVGELCRYLQLSQSQCQRNFRKHYGLTPKVALSILRFHKAITMLTSTKSKPSDVLEVVHYYDQAHFINDFKRNIGITPLELLARYPA